ncbi:DUF5125 domain-containing protein [Marinilabilia salmonicolor]|jgi:hypothetical protein|uniref:Uncharacterized protein DUF5016 n=1 Tax=Marinilabilia salmonicolor TaxID=989 RepID=A0A2T0XCH8_9BACT|nr:DUF5125 domain-containing protein [Marinilabilia salmonicolor]PRY96628.1 uncharacterized protein DUF5016 [Marinilabilia salmonicolor]RCW33249.1 uncharacterized protein DUF5016 [Marinilabilia salmonicolor]
MKRKYLFFSILFVFLGFVACEDDETVVGDPELTVQTNITAAHFGDSIPFAAAVSDDEVPLSTLKAQLFFGDEMVEETVIRTKTNGEYSGKIYVPFHKDIPNGTGRLKFIVQNIEFAIEEETFEVALSRPDYPSVTLVTAEGDYLMEKVDAHRYAVTANFPQKVKGYIKAPAITEDGNEMIFGWASGEITEGTYAEITFSSYAAGEYEIFFNTLTYQAGPFISLEFAGHEMTMIDDENFKVEADLEKEQVIEVDGIANLDEWWIDEDFFANNGDGTLTFKAISGKYRVIANFTHEYFVVEAMSGNDLATLQSDGSGALWIIGDGIGKPSLDNQVGWNTDKALCMAPISEKVYRVTVVGGESIDANSINFKFFHQKGWGGEYTNAALSTTSDIVLVGDGENGRDPGNLGLVEGVTLTQGATYVFEVDITAGLENAVLSVTQE